MYKTLHISQFIGSIQTIFFNCTELNALYTKSHKTQEKKRKVENLGALVHSGCALKLFECNKISFHWMEGLRL